MCLAVMFNIRDNFEAIGKGDSDLGVVGAQECTSIPGFLY